MTKKMISKKTAEEAAQTMLNLMFPRRCPVCDRPVRPFGKQICMECEERWIPLSPSKEPLCCRCGKPLPDWGQEYCEDCRQKSHDFVRGCAVFRYRDVSGAIFRFKYEGRAEYASYFGSKMVERFVQEFDPSCVDALIPIPLSKEKLRKRGYNQAHLLAKELGKKTGILVRNDLLERRQDTQALKKVSGKERRRYLEKAFIVSGNDVKSKVFLLVDDIYTTGATMDACAELLLAKGAQSVFFITLAIGEGEG